MPKDTKKPTKKPTKLPKPLPVEVPQYDFDEDEYVCHCFDDEDEYEDY